MEPADEELLARYGRHPAPPAEGEVVEGPTDEELWDIGERHLWTGTDESVTNYRILTSFIEAARVVLARYGHQPAPPAEGEVAELTRWLRMQGEAQKPGPNSLLSDRTKKEHHAAGVRLTRAADLLEQRHPAPPTDGEVADLIAWLGDEADQYDCIQQAPETARRLRRAADLFAQRQPAPPAEGEVAELVAALRSQAIDCTCDHLTSGDLRRAADLLEQRHPEPVPVSERLPEPGDCDAEGLCWVWHTTAYTWGLFRLDPTVHSHWLPATALPLPAAEVRA